MENMEDLKKLYEYINNELIPKYDGLEKCTMHILLDVLEAKVEFLIKANENLDFDDFGLLNYLINIDIIYQRRIRKILPICRKICNRNVLANNIATRGRLRQFTELV